MANDRLFIACDVCGQAAKVGKYYPTPNAEQVDHPDVLAAFVTKHINECGKPGEDLEGAICVRFAHEGDVPAPRNGW
jgi:hypothetical protein